MLDPKSPEYWLNQSLINGEKALQQTIATGYAQDQAYRSEKNSQHATENLNIAHHNIAHLKNELDQAVEINKELFQAGMKYKEEAEYYQKLLTKPMAEIAQANRSFKEAYEAQMELLADWMVSQKALKELAIQFGIEMAFLSINIIMVSYIRILGKRHLHSMQYHIMDNDQLQDVVHILQMPN